MFLGEEDIAVAATGAKVEWNIAGLPCWAKTIPGILLLAVMRYLARFRE